jgi:hypothetical protein
MNAHMGAMLKYDQAIYEDHDCDECAIENNINNINSDEEI